MTNENGSSSPVGRKVVLILAVLGAAAIFFASMLYRWENPSLQKAMRQQGQAAPTESAQAPAGGMPGGMPEGMAGMDMEGVRAMMDGLEKRLEENPKDIEALLQLASIRTMRGDLEASADYVERAQQAAQGNKAALMEIASRWFEMERFDKAATALEAILAAEPDEMFAHYNLGVLYKYRLEQPDKAEKHLRRVVDSEHDFADLREQARKALEDG